MRIRLVATGTVLTVACAVTGCSAAPVGGGKAEADAVQRAQTAGIVMTRGGGYPVPVADAAYGVVGDLPEASIKALRADGTTWQGTVVLAIQVTTDPDSMTQDTFRGCFRYDFRHTLADSTPHRVSSCPAAPVLSLRPPAPPPTVDAAAVRRALTALTPGQRLRLPAVRQAVQAAVGPAFAVDVEPPTPTAAYRPNILISIRSNPPLACLTAYITPHGSIKVSAPLLGLEHCGG